MSALKPVLLMDRDGTLIQDPGYLNDPERVRWMPWMPGVFRWLRRREYGVRVVTNQSGIRRGWVSRRNLQAIHERLRWELWRAAGVWVRFTVCPHHPSERCGCRKPGVAGVRTDMAREGERPVAMVGDRRVDQDAARRLGVPFLAAHTLPGSLEHLE